MRWADALAFFNIRKLLDQNGQAFIACGGKCAAICVPGNREFIWNRLFAGCFGILRATLAELVLHAKHRRIVLTLAQLNGLVFVEVVSPELRLLVN